MYVLSERQCTALANLEGFLQRRQGLRQFADRAEFQRYWDQLTKQCDRLSHQRKSETESARRGRLETRKLKIQQYYNDEERLVAYAHQYRIRYQPSTEKLRAQLLVKSANAEVVEAVMGRLQGHLDDDIRARELAERMREQGRNGQFIQAKLQQRKFSTETIKQCLKACAEDSGSLWDPDVLTRKVAQLKRKGLSRSAIRSKLCERPADGPLVDAALTALFADDGDLVNVASAVAKLRKRNLEPPVIFRRLQAKGFSFSAIKQALNAQ
jgi:SOS response regulatory protein OraA/RecX